MTDKRITIPIMKIKDNNAVKSTQINSPTEKKTVKNNTYLPKNKTKKISPSKEKKNETNKN